MIQGKAICRWSWRKQAHRALVGAGSRRREPFTEPPQGPGQASQMGVGQRRRPQLHRALGRRGLSFADEPCLERAELCPHA